MFISKVEKYAKAAKWDKAMLKTALALVDDGTYKATQELMKMMEQ